MEKSNDLLHFCPKRLLADGMALHKTFPNGNAVISHKINAIIKYSDHTCRTKLQHRRLHF